MPIALRAGSVAVPDPTSPVDPPRNGAGHVFPRSARPGIAGMTWTGTDGSTWDLLRPSSGVMLLEGATGFTPDAYAPWVSKSSAHGQVFRGGRFDARSVLWPLLLFHDGSSSELVDRIRAWWASFPYDPATVDDYGVWEVISPRGDRRRAYLRLEDSGETWDLDPTRRGWVLSMTKLVMDVPFWEGDPVGLSWSSPSAVSTDGFFQPEAGGVLRIGGGFTTDRAAITNPGDVEAWPVWTIQGPWNTATLGVAGRTVKVPFAGTATDTLVVDTQQASAYLNGADVTHRLSSWEWAAVPPGKSVALDVVLDGTGTVAASLTPLYHRAMG